MYDTNKSGKIDFGQLKNMLLNLCNRKKVQPMSDSQVKKLMERYDIDGSGELDKKEVLKMLAPLKMASLDSRKESIFKSSYNISPRVSTSPEKAQYYCQDDNLSVCSAMFLPDIRGMLAKKEHEKARGNILLNFADVLLKDLELDPVQMRESPRYKNEQSENHSKEILNATSQYVSRSNVPVGSIMNLESSQSSRSDTHEVQSRKEYGSLRFTQGGTGDNLR
jgi:hypothetical protein